MRRASKSVAIGSALLLSVAGAGASLAFVNAEQPAKPEKINICHATKSSKNPYISSQVDASSVNLDGHINHSGPIYFEGIDGEWGDIIPPVPEILPEGFNWPEGEATLMNGCTFVAPSPSPTEPEPTESPTEPEPTESPTEPEPTESPTEPEPTESPTEPEPTESPTEPEPSATPTPTPTSTPTTVTTPAPTTPAASPEVTVTPASPETPAPVDGDEVAPVEIADPGALPVDDDQAAVEPASPQQASVPTSVPAGGGAASRR